MNIFIVDDEAPIRRYIASCIKEAPGHHTVSIFQSAKQVLSCIDQDIPDLIFVDITMPKMNGLELLKLIKKKYSSVAVFMLTCHNDFEFARAALQNGADGYILKDEISPKYFTEVLAKAIAQKKDRESHREIKYLNLDDFDFNDVFHIKEFIKSDPFFVVTFYGNNKNIEYINLNKPEFIKRQKLYPSQNSIGVMLMVIDQQYNAREVEAGLKEYIATLGNHCERIVGISGLQKDITYLKTSLLEALDDRNNRFYGAACSNAGAAYSESDARQHILNLSNEAIACLNDGDRTGYCNKIMSIIRYTEFEQHVEVPFLKSVLSTLYRSNKMSDCEVQNTATFVEMKEVLSKDLSLVKKSAVQFSMQTQNALNYINAHYHQNINLKTVAGYVYLNSDYFGRHFKQEVGMNFSEYLQRTRMKNAKKLLLTTNLKIGEIAEKVGISSVSYFSLVFNKEYGVKPNEIRKRNKLEIPEN